jgi:uncharacterized surface protein with fasciclin (FAS1) repeats
LTSENYWLVKLGERTLKYSTSKLLGLGALLLALPVVTACNPNTAEAPIETSPEVGEVPMPEEPMTEDPTMAPMGAGETITDVAAADASLSTFNSAVEAAGLSEALSQPGPYTVFAPSDEAFAALPPETLEQLLLPENQDQLRQILSYHVVPAALTSDQLQSGEVPNLAGESLSVEADPSAQLVTVNEAAVTQPNIQASNGIVHVIDQVILPPALASR